VNVISKKHLLEFWQSHPLAQTPLRSWFKLLSQVEPTNFAELKESFGSVDLVKDYVVFDVGGNKFRIIAIVYFESKLVLIRHVFTHDEYNHWNAIEEQSWTLEPRKPKPERHNHEIFEQSVAPMGIFCRNRL
jgi:mRNA interferase HigB